MKVRKFTEEEIQYIIESYKTDSLQKIADNLKTSKKKIKEELIKQNIELSDHRKREDKVSDFDYEDELAKCYPDIEGEHYVAIHKVDGKEFNDYLNKSGVLSVYLRDNYGIDAPTNYFKAKYLIENKRPWIEEYFDIVSVKNIIKEEKIIIDQDIVNDYVDKHMSLAKICKKYKIGQLHLDEILSKNGVDKNKVKKPLISDNFIVSDYRIQKYPEIKGKHYVVTSKIDNESFLDINNKGGFLTSYISKVVGIEVPTFYYRRRYYQETGNYWWEQWFNVELVDDAEVKKCPYCEWFTVDVDNKSGAFAKHMKESHNIDVEKYLKKYPDDAKYFVSDYNKIKHKEFLKDDKNYVICPICGEKLEKITSFHIKHIHNMDYYDFLKKYPKCKIYSETALEQIKRIQKMSNLNVTKNRFISKHEKEIRSLLDFYNIKYETNRQMLIGKEIDILIEDKKVGIEFDGLVWHTEWFGKKPHNYHLDKTIKCNEKGYGLIHIFEDEYVEHKDIVISKLKHILGIKENKPNAYGRKCIVKEIYKHDAEIFLNKYHIQGFSSATVYLGAFFEDEIVGVMTFKNGNIGNVSWELARFATNDNFNCTGVGGKLFKYFIRNYNPIEIHSFADRRWTIDINNNLYTKLGFIISKINAPDYRYYDKHSRKNRYKRFHKMLYNKKTMSKKYGFPMTMTETEMAKKLGLDRIWDCGLVKYVWRNGY